MLAAKEDAKHGDMDNQFAQYRRSCKRFILRHHVSIFLFRYSTECICADIWMRTSNRNRRAKRQVNTILCQRLLPLK